MREDKLIVGLDYVITPITEYPDGNINYGKRRLLEYRGTEDSGYGKRHVFYNQQNQRIWELTPMSIRTWVSEL